MPYKDIETRRKHYRKNKKRMAENSRKWYQLNKKKVANRNKVYYQENREKLIKQAREYRKTHKKEKGQYCEKHKKEQSEYGKEYRFKNRGKIGRRMQKYYQSNKKQICENHKYRYHNDIRFKLNDSISTAIWKSLKNGKGGLHWEKPVGYTLKDLMKHLKKTLPQGMTWQDYLDGKLHIDHKIPIYAFNFDDINHLDFKRCWALDNLQFLKATDNLRKGKKINKSFQPSLRV